VFSGSPYVHGLPSPPLAASIYSSVGSAPNAAATPEIAFATVAVAAAAAAVHTPASSVVPVAHVLQPDAASAVVAPIHAVHVAAQAQTATSKAVPASKAA
jgi:hypothetical protein